MKSYLQEKGLDLIFSDFFKSGYQYVFTRENKLNSAHSPFVSILLLLLLLLIISLS